MVPVAGLLVAELVDMREVVEELPAGRFGAPAVELVRGRLGGTFSVFEVPGAVEGFLGFGVLASASDGNEDVSTAGTSGAGASVGGGGASASAIASAESGMLLADIIEQRKATTNSRGTTRQK